MKKIIIVNNNMKVGGVQKSLCNLLWELRDNKEYDITLVLFNAVGEYMDKLPPDTKCIALSSLFRYMGISQGETKGLDVLKRGFLAATCRIFGRSLAIRFMLLSQKMMPEKYDYAISFLHNGRNKSFFGGVQEFVLYRVNAKKKITFLHDDYSKCGANHSLNNKLMERFDKIASCSDGCRNVFEELLPQVKPKSVTVRNCNNIAEIKAMANQDPISYDTDRINVVCVARLSPRKGIDRAVEAAVSVLNKHIPITLHVIGNGVMENELKEKVKLHGVEKNVIFYGAQSNPYRFMKNADLLFLTSYHEAAPMVIDESYILGVPVLTARTNSSDEMVTSRNGGWVCENSQEALNEALFNLTSNRELLAECKKMISENPLDNSKAVHQFEKLIED